MDTNEIKKPKCPKCGDVNEQHKKGFTGAGSQRWYCKMCDCKYTPEPKKWEYTEDERRLALRILSDGNTGRGVGRAMKMSKSNAYRWASEEAKKGPMHCG